MKKSAVIPLMALALLVPFGAVMGEEDRPAAVEEARQGRMCTITGPAGFP